MAAIEFSPFDKDTLPKLEHVVRKNDVLLIVRLGKKKVENRMAVIPMITIYPEADSSLLASDSLANDSLAADDELIPEEGEENLSDSTTVEKEPAPDENAEEPSVEEARPKDEEEQNPEEVKPEEPAEKVVRKTRKTVEKDPELSDPGLKFEFEESFQDSLPEDEFVNPIPLEDEDIPAPKKDDKRKANPVHGDADKPKDEEEEATDDKF